MSLILKWQTFTGLAADYAKSVDARTLIRGLRMSSDFEREFEMALMNQQLYPELDTVCLMTCLEYQFVTANTLKEVVSLGGDALAVWFPNMLPKH